MRMYDVIVAFESIPREALQTDAVRKAFYWLGEVVDRTGPAAIWFKPHRVRSYGFYTLMKVGEPRDYGDAPWGAFHLVSLAGGPDVVPYDAPLAVELDVPSDLELLAPDWLLDAVAAREP